MQMLGRQVGKSLLLGQLTDKVRLRQAGVLAEIWRGVSRGESLAEGIPGIRSMAQVMSGSSYMLRETKGLQQVV